MIEYEFWLSDITGQLITVLDGFLTATIQRSVNQLGKMVINLPWGKYPDSMFDDNQILTAWRSIDNSPLTLVGQCPFFLQTASKGLSSQGIRTLDLAGYDPLLFLATHTIDYAAGTAYADKSLAADDMQKAYVFENLGIYALDVTRNMSPWLTVQSYLSGAPVISKSASNRPLLAVLQEIAAKSFEAGTYLAFDIICPDQTHIANLEFRTYISVRGTDRRYGYGTKPVILDPDNGNLVDLVRTLDNANLANAIRAGGQGEGYNRTFAQSLDTSSINQSVWNRRELFIDARNSDTAANVQAEADAALRANRKRQTFSARFVPTPNMQLFRDLNYGDYITCVWDGERYDMRFDAYQLTIANGQETPDIALRSDA